MARDTAVWLGLAVLLAGCSDPPPPAGTLPEIPPGRSATQTGQPLPGEKADEGLVPQPPK